MQRKAALENLSMLSGLLIMVLLVTAVALFTSFVLKAQPDSRAPILYNQFIQYYQTCVSQETTDCYCDEFDFSLLPQTEYIQLQQLPDHKISIELRKPNVAQPLKTTVVQGKDLCTYYLSFGVIEGEFVKKPVATHKISVDASYTPSTHYFLTLYHDATHACFINHNAAGPFGEPSFFLYKRTGPGTSPADNLDGAIKEQFLSCKHKKDFGTAPTPPDGLFPSS